MRDPTCCRKSAAELLGQGGRGDSGRLLCELEAAGYLTTAAPLQPLIQPAKPFCTRDKASWHPHFDPLSYDNLHPVRRAAALKQQQAAREWQSLSSISCTRNQANDVSDAELRAAHVAIKSRTSTQFRLLTDAFRKFDADASGRISTKEVAEFLSQLNLRIEPRVLHALVGLADFDRDGEVSYAEFARLLTAEDVLNMKHTLCAAGEGATTTSRTTGRKAKEPREAFSLPVGTTASMVREFADSVKDKLLSRHFYLNDAFKALDTDRSGKVSDAELKMMLLKLNMHPPPGVLKAMLSLADQSGNGELDYKDFARWLSVGDIMSLKKCH